MCRVIKTKLFIQKFYIKELMKLHSNKPYFVLYCTRRSVINITDMWEYVFNYETDCTYMRFSKTTYYAIQICVPKRWYLCALSPRRLDSADIAHFIKPCRDQEHFVNWISVRFYETCCIYISAVRCPNVNGILYVQRILYSVIS